MQKQTNLYLLQFVGYWNITMGFVDRTRVTVMVYLGQDTVYHLIMTLVLFRLHLNTCFPNGQGGKELFVQNLSLQLRVYGQSQLFNRDSWQWLYSKVCSLYIKYGLYGQRINVKELIYGTQKQAVVAETD
ncbi:Hypothetical_protein [Hexamita inflata]|uniref:Hypothetical_protein n=1 Tax=Hexamita inflata TaxID=28002 RepID=A0ABP1HB22_9EUKA